MLEKTAIRLLYEGQDSFHLITIGLTILGAVIAALFTRSKAEIVRAPYFAKMSMVFLWMTASDLIGLHVVSAMLGGYLWLSMLIWTAVLLTGGFYYFRNAMARSRDAYGHSRMALLALIPIANLWLCFAPSQKAVSANSAKTIPILSGALGVLTGFAMLGATAGMGFYLRELQQRQIERYDAMPATQRAVVHMAVQSIGLEGALKLLFENEHEPPDLGDAISLVRTEVVGTQLRLTYVADQEGLALTDEFWRESTRATCALIPYEPLLRAGAEIHQVYVDPGGREIGVLTVTRLECGY